MENIALFLRTLPEEECCIRKKWSHVLGEDITPFCQGVNGQLPGWAKGEPVYPIQAKEPVHIHAEGPQWLQSRLWECELDILVSAWGHVVGLLCTVLGSVKGKEFLVQLRDY